MHKRESIACNSKQSQSQTLSLSSSSSEDIFSDNDFSFTDNLSPSNKHLQKNLDSVSNAISMTEALDCIRQLKAANQQLQIHNQPDSYTYIRLSPDCIELKEKNEQLWGALDHSFYRLRRPFISNLQYYHNNLMTLSSGNFMPYSNKIEKAECVAEFGHAIHTLAAFLETGLELIETLGVNLPKYMHLLQPAMACAFSIAFPIIPLISGIYTIAKNEILIREAKKLSFNLSQFTASERELIFEALFLLLSNQFKDRITASRPNVKLRASAGQKLKANHKAGIDVQSLWKEVLPYIATVGLAKMPAQKFDDVNQFIEAWKHSLTKLINYRGNKMTNNNQLVLRQTQFQCALKVKEILNRNLSEQEMRQAYQQELPTGEDQYPSHYFYDLCVNVLAPFQKTLSDKFLTFFTRSNKINVQKEMLCRVRLALMEVNHENVEPDEMNVIHGLIQEYLNNMMTIATWCSKLINFVSHYSSMVTIFKVEPSETDPQVVEVSTAAAIQTYQELLQLKEENRQLQIANRGVLEERDQALTLVKEQALSLSEYAAQFKSTKAELDKIKASRALAQQQNQGKGKANAYHDRTLDKADAPTDESRENSALREEISKQAQLVSEQSIQIKHLQRMVNELISSRACENQNENGAASSSSTYGQSF